MGQTSNVKTRTVYCAEVEIAYDDGKYETFTISGCTPGLRNKAMDRLIEDEGEVNYCQRTTKIETFLLRGADCYVTL